MFVISFHEFSRIWIIIKIHMERKTPNNFKKHYSKEREKWKLYVNE